MNFADFKEFWKEFKEKMMENYSINVVDFNTMLERAISADEETSFDDAMRQVFDNDLYTVLMTVADAVVDQGYDIRNSWKDIREEYLQLLAEHQVEGEIKGEIKRFKKWLRGKENVQNELNEQINANIADDYESLQKQLKELKLLSAEIENKNEPYNPYNFEYDHGRNFLQIMTQIDSKIAPNDTTKADNYYKQLYGLAKRYEKLVIPDDTKEVISRKIDSVNQKINTTKSWEIVVSAEKEHEKEVDRLATKFYAECEKLANYSGGKKTDFFDKMNESLKNLQVAAGMYTMSNQKIDENRERYRKALTGALEETQRYIEHKKKQWLPGRTGSKRLKEAGKIFDILTAMSDELAEYTKASKNKEEKNKKMEGEMKAQDADRSGRVPIGRKGLEKAVTGKTEDAEKSGWVVVSNKSKELQL